MALLDQLGFFAQVLAAVDAAAVSPRDDPRLQELRAQGYTPEGIDAVLQLGFDRGITDPREAAQAYERDFPPPTPVGTAGARWDGLTPPRPAPPPDMAELLAGGNDQQWTNRAVAATLKELRSPDPSPVLNLLTAGFS